MLVEELKPMGLQVLYQEPLGIPGAIVPLQYNCVKRI